MSVRGARTSRRWVWFLLFVGGSMLAGLQSRPGRLGQASPPTDVAVSAGQPVQSLLTRVGGGLAGAGHFVGNVFELQGENARLRRQVRQSQAQSEQLTEWQQEVARLRGLLRLREAVDVPAVAARAIARGPSSWFRTLTIGVGRRDGIQPGSAVLAPGGLLGQVYQVSYASSQVLCLVDRLGSVGARLQPERARQVIGVCKGDGTSLCTLVYSNANADVRPGDAVVTSGQEQGSLFPPGLLIGHVVSIERRPDQSSLVCHIRPAVDPDLAEEVLVLTPGTPEGRS